MIDDALIGLWSNDALYSPGAMEDDLIFFRLDGSGWLAWMNAFECDVNTFTWSVTSDAQINIIGVRCVLRHTVVLGQSYDVEITPSDLSYCTTYFVKTEQTIIYGDIPVLHMQKRIGTSDGRFGKISDEPLPSVARLLAAEKL